MSDQIGFHYQRSPPESPPPTSWPVCTAFAGGRRRRPGALVRVILDGENCWEYYPDGGVSFLRSLYRRCTTTPGVRPVTIGEFLARHPPHDTLPRLFAGSWISHNFAIWIGHPEDNTRLGRPASQPASSWSPRSAKMARHGCTTAGDTICTEGLGELYIAEGSDWFWWYGDDHSSAQDALFDHLFRKHLRNVYPLLGDEPPAALARPISRRGRGAVHYTAPRAFLDVKIDGRATFFEWINAGRYACSNERGTMTLVARAARCEESVVRLRRRAAA